MSVQATGQCLCGAVSITGTFSDQIGACHCRQCQQWTGGGPLLSVDVAGDVTVTGAENIRSYKASPWGERCSCATCGSTLWWKMADKDISSVTVGLFDDQSVFHVASEIFTDYRPGWLPHWPDASQSTEAQEHAKLAAYMKDQNQ